MFDFPDLDTISPFSGPAALMEVGSAASGAVSDAAGSAWDWGADALANVGSLDPSLLGGPFMPSLGGSGTGAGAGAAGGSMGDPLPFGMLDPQSIADATAEFSPGGVADASADYSPYKDDFLY